MTWSAHERFIPVGNAHTTLLQESSGSIGSLEIGSLDTEIEGVTVLQWFTAMVEGNEVWDDRVDPSLL